MGSTSSPRDPVVWPDWFSGAGYSDVGVRELIRILHTCGYTLVMRAYVVSIELMLSPYVNGKEPPLNHLTLDVVHLSDTLPRNHEMCSIRSAQ
jgi:hypothetical protein